MKFRVQHSFSNISMAEYEKLYFDEDFNTALCTAVKLARTLVSREVKGGHISRVVTVGADREIPAFAAKLLGSNRIEYTEHLEYDFGSGRGTWKTKSSLLTDKVNCHGTIAFSESGSKVTRVVDGDIKVKIFGVGGVVEKFIVADIEKSYDRAAAFTQDWIDNNES